MSRVGASGDAVDGTAILTGVNGPASSTAFTLSAINVLSRSHLVPGLPGTNNGIGTIFAHGVHVSNGGFVDFNFLPNAAGNSTVDVGAGTLQLDTTTHFNLLAANTTNTIEEYGTFTLFTSVGTLIPPGTIAVNNADPASTYSLSHVGT